MGCSVCGCESHYAKGLCKACYERARPGWPLWLGACLQCGAKAGTRAYRSHGLCKRCASQGGDRTAVVLRYYMARWQGRTLERAIVYLSRGVGLREVARVIGEQPDVVRRAVDSGGPLPLYWGHRLASYLEESVCELPADRQKVPGDAS